MEINQKIYFYYTSYLKLSLNEGFVIPRCFSILTYCYHDKYVT